MSAKSDLISTSTTKTGIYVMHAETPLQHNETKVNTPHQRIFTMQILHKKAKNRKLYFQVNSLNIPHVLWESVLQRFWTKHRLATVLCFALLFLGLLLQPWSLVLVLAVSFGGPLLKRLERFKASPINSWRRNHWIGVALGLSVVLLALTGGSSGRGALILALLPVAWVLVTDRSLLQDHKQIERGSSDEPLALSATDAEVENNTEPPEPLVGAELLAKVKELGDVGKSDLVRACGYFSIKEDGGERINFTGFYEALLEAKGIDMSISTADSDDGEESESSDKEPINLPSDWKDLESHEIVDRLRDSVEVRPDVLTALASSEDWTVGQAVAWHDNTPDDVVKKLADDDDSDVSQAIHDRKLPKTWRFMDRDEKIEALKSDDVPSEIIESLASSEDWRLRQAVAWSPSTSKSILERLKDDEDVDVRNAATVDQKLPQDWRFLSSTELVERLRRESQILEILSCLVKHSSSDVRRAVALHPDTSDELLVILEGDTDEIVQSGIRERRLPQSWKVLPDDERIAELNSDNIPESVLVILARSGNYKVRRAVALSPATSKAILDSLLNDVYDDVQSVVRERDLADEWKSLEDDEMVEKLGNKAADQNTLKILSQSAAWSIRQAVAENQGASEELLRDLLKDDDDDVKRAAKKN